MNIIVVVSIFCLSFFLVSIYLFGINGVNVLWLGTRNGFLCVSGVTLAAFSFMERRERCPMCDLLLYGCDGKRGYINGYGGCLGVKP